MNIGDAVVIDPGGLDALIAVLGELGYETKGPVVRDGAIVPGPVTGLADLPVGYRDDQAPGHYRLKDATTTGSSPGPWDPAPGRPSSSPPHRSCGGPPWTMTTWPSPSPIPRRRPGHRRCASL